MLQNVEFIMYKAFPEDQYTAAMCKLRFDKRYVVTYVAKKMKDGGQFWAAPSSGVNDGGEKRYLSGFKLDSDVENELLIEFIKDNVRKRTSGQSGVAMTGTLGSDMATSTGVAGVAPKSEVAVDEPLPF